jgi:hypothetical protein
MPKDDKKSKKLDEAIEKTFPASDPVNVGTATGTEPSGKPVDRAPPLITKEQIDAAQRGEGHALRDHLPSSVDEKVRHDKHHGLADQGLEDGEEPRKTEVKDHGGLGRKGKA